MTEQLQVGPGGAAGAAVDIGTAQVRVRWYTGAGDTPTAVFRDAAGTVLRRFPGTEGDVVVDNGEWLLDLGRLAGDIARVELLVDFAGARPAGFVASVGHRTLSHPGAMGEPDRLKVLARVDRAPAGWFVVPFDQVVLSETAVQQEQHTQGRLLVLVDSSGSMAAPLADGRVTAAVVDAIRATGRPTVVLRASDAGTASLPRDAESLQREIAGFVAQLAARPRRSSSDLVASLRALGIDHHDDLVVVTDAPPSDVDAVTAALGEQEATWLVVGAAALAETSADRRRWAALTASGRVQRRLSGIG